MKKNPKFKVNCPQNLFEMLMLLNAFFIILIIMYTIFSEPPHYPMYITITLFIFAPSIIVGLWIKLFKVSVTGNTITVRRGTGIKYSFDVSEIVSIKWKKVDTNFAHTERVTIKTISKKFSIDTAMNGFKKMSAYILENVDKNKIQIINIDRKSNAR